jgi:hypothetical protein
MLTSNESIKNSKSRLLRISSEDKITGTNGRFSVDVLAAGGIIDNIKGYIVHSIQAPNVFDNIPSYANVFTVIKTTGLVSYDITVPTSYYYIDDLAAALQTAINAAIPDTVAVIKSGTAPTEKFSFTFTGDEYTIQLSSTIASRIGITGDLTCPDGVGTAAQNIPNLIGETELYIHSRDLAPNNLIEGSGSFSVVDKLNLDKPYGAMCYSIFNTDTTHFKKYFPFESLKTLRTVRITVRNRTGEQLTLPDNFNLSIMLTVFYK